MPIEPKRTSFTRYRRVSDILQDDPLLKTKLSKNMAAVCRGQSHTDFPIEVVFITDHIHKQGIDAYTMPKNEVVKVAFDLLVENPIPIPMPAPLPPAPEKKKAAKVKAVKPKPKPKVKPKRKALPKAPATAEPSPAAVAESPGETQGDGVVKLRPAPAFVRPGVPLSLGVASMSNLEAAAMLLESIGDATYRPIVQKIQEVIDEIRLHTVLPSAQKDVQPAG